MICLGISLHAINVPITATILPSAVAEIGGLDFLSWAVMVFLVVSIMTSVSAGLVQRRIGVRRAYLAAALVFASGSLVCALAPAMWVLLVGRGLQGAGGGLILALGYALIRRLFPERLWAKIFALLSGIWGGCALMGAFIGGIFADLWTWRGAYFVMVPLALLLAASVWRILPASHAGDAGRGGYPTVRLALIATAILAIASSGNVAGAALSLGLVAVAIPLILLALRLDARASSRLLPRGAFSFGNIVGSGLWIAFALMMASYSFATYGPVLLQTLHGVPATLAGGFVAWSSFAWTIMALLVASIADPPERLFIVAGPIVMAVGLVGLAVVLPAGPFWAIPPLVFCLGGGIGMGWAFLCKRIMSFAAEDDGDTAAAAIPTTQMFGMAFGAAFSGLIANAAGFADGLSVATASSVASWLHGSFALVLVVALAAAIRMIGLEGKAGHPSA